MPKPVTDSSRWIGSTLILAGTAIGAGMLALPLVSASVGLLPMLLVFLVTAFFSAGAALLTLEVNLAVEPGCNLYVMASRTLGRLGKVLATVTPLCLFYSLMTAYLSGGGALLSRYIQELAPAVSTGLCVLLFSLMAGIFVYWSASAVDWVNRIFFGLMIVAFVSVLAALAPSVRYERVMDLQEVGGLTLLGVLPVVFTSFGYHGSIPSIILYQKAQLHQSGLLRNLSLVFILATLIPLMVYSSWLIMVHGVLAESRLLDISRSPESLSVLIGEFSKDSKGSVPLHLFSDFALLTSVLGVALGLFDYLAGLFRRGNDRLQRFQTVCITFGPPVVFATLFPGGFVKALGYAAVALSILAVLLPSVMVCVLRKRSASERRYQAPGGLWLVYACLFFGCIVVLAQLITA
ncbi:MAG: amino acid permease [Endozoicomonas sp.]